MAAQVVASQVVLSSTELVSFVVWCTFSCCLGFGCSVTGEEFLIYETFQFSLETN
jgi:hypothetical protein